MVSQHESRNSSHGSPSSDADGSVSPSGPQYQCYLRSGITGELTGIRRARGVAKCPHLDSTPSREAASRAKPKASNQGPADCEGKLEGRRFKQFQKRRPFFCPPLPPASMVSMLVRRVCVELRASDRTSRAQEHDGCRGRIRRVQGRADGRCSRSGTGILMRSARRSYPVPRAKPRRSTGGTIRSSSAATQSAATMPANTSIV